MSDVEVKRNLAESRYEAWLDGELAGFAQYTDENGGLAFTHTEVFDKFEGRGVGGALARGALDDVKGSGVGGVIARCPFIRSWIEKHPDYQYLLSGE